MNDGTAGRPSGIQRYAAPTGRSNPDARVPLKDFIGYVEDVERGYPNDTPFQILTRIRNQYYGDFSFQRLIPKAPYLEVTGTQRVFNRQDGEEYETPITRLRTLEEGAIGPAAYRHLTAQADENAKGDNPSPYLIMPNGQGLDVGHLLLGLDALLHPGTLPPYSDYSVPNIDPASWGADLGIASVWMTVHQETGEPHDAVVNPPASADLDVYYKKSAPEEDLLGDVDSFGLHAQWQAASAQRLSQVMRNYYLGGGNTSVPRRFQIFCAANGFGYTQSGNAISWDPALPTRLVARIDVFNELYFAGKSGVALTMVTGYKSSPRKWPHTPAVVDKFLAWVKKNLEAELAARK